MKKFVTLFILIVYSLLAQSFGVSGCDFFIELYDQAQTYDNHTELISESKLKLNFDLDSAVQNKTIDQIINTIEKKFHKCELITFHSFKMNKIDKNRFITCMTMIFKVNKSNNLHLNLYLNNTEYVKMNDSDCGKYNYISMNAAQKILGQVKKQKPEFIKYYIVQS